MLTEKEKAEGWLELFDGKTLKGWGTTGNPEGWGVEDGAIVCLVKRGGYCHTVEKFEDFILHVDFKINPGVNSGIFFRWSDLTDPVNTGYEMQILDTYGPHRTGIHDCGALYELVPPKKQTMKPAGEWNHVVIECRDSLVRMDMNGENIVEMDSNLWDTPHKNPDGTLNKFSYAWKDLPRRGHLGLQDHGGKVWFRNIRILPLK